jgi:MYND finger
MPPSSTSKNKKKGGKSKKPKPIDEEEEKKLAEAFAASTMGQEIGLTDELLVEAARKVPAGVDNPPCDECSKPFGGTMQCAQCESVFYCGRDCQVSHWSSKHNAECARLKQQNEAMAERVLSNFKICRWEFLDSTGTYKAAVRLGLHDKIREVLDLDRTSIVYRCRSDGEFICYTVRLTQTIFRGQRAEGRNQKPEVPVVDGLRIKKYVRSHPEAFATWLQASVQLLHAVLDRTTRRRNPDNHRTILQLAEEVWHTWHLVFVNSVACRAILTSPPSTTDGANNISEKESVAAATQLRTTIEDRARRLVITLRDTLHLIDGVSNPLSDPVTTPFSGVSLTAATVQLRLEEFRIGVNAEAIFDLTGSRKQNYQRLLLPLAKRAIEKGSGLNAQEASAVMALAQGLGQR